MQSILYPSFLGTVFTALQHTLGAMSNHGNGYIAEQAVPTTQPLWRISYEAILLSLLLFYSTKVRRFHPSVVIVPFMVDAFVVATSTISCMNPSRAARKGSGKATFTTQQSVAETKSGQNYDLICALGRGETAATNWRCSLLTFGTVHASAPKKKT